mgnify:CR=1 FL=1
MNSLVRSTPVRSGEALDTGQLIGYLRPILPGIAAESESFLRIDPLTWDKIAEPLGGHTVAKFKPLMTRVDKERIDAMIEASKEALKDEPLVRWKESYKKALGLNLTTTPGLDV